MARKARVEFAGAFTDRDQAGEQIYRRERKDREGIGIKCDSSGSLGMCAIGKIVSDFPCIDLRTHDGGRTLRHLRLKLAVRPV